MRKKVGFWLFIALSLLVVPACNKADSKASEREAEVQKLRAEVADRDWEIVALKAKLGDPGAVAAKTRDLLIGKWAGVVGTKTERMTLEFTKDGTYKETLKGQEGEGIGFRGKGLDTTITGEYIWLDDDHIGLTRKVIGDPLKPFREKHKVVVTKDDLAFTDPDGDLGKYKRVN
jgi:hypothetical protein